MVQRFWPLLLPLALAACGEPEGAIVSDSDRATGARQHSQLLAEFGGEYRGDEAGYVKQLGERMAAAAGLAEQCSFTLVNSDVVNAFAVPGCYIYVTRGLMGIVNSEAELAAVLGHEVGHIVGRHAQRQQRRSLWRTLGVMAVGMLTGSETDADRRRRRGAVHLALFAGAGISGRRPWPRLSAQGRARPL